MRDELKEQYWEAVRLNNAGELEAAKNILMDLAERDPTSTRLLAVLGKIYWDLGVLEEAVDTFKRATLLSPKLEAVSLGLFHCLWKLDRREEAFEELKRFQTISDSQDYRAIVREINEKW